MNEQKFLAHINTTNGKTQTLLEHCFNVKRLCEISAEPFGIKNTAGLIGLLHDLGKATEHFSTYIRLQELLEKAESQSEKDRLKKQIGKVHHVHALAGATFVYDQLSSKGVGQLIAMSIVGHHSGLYDGLNIQGESPFLKMIKPDKGTKEAIHYDEACANFLQNIADIDKLRIQMTEAQIEIKTLTKGMKAFERGMLLRVLHSILVDADRWDSCCFEYNSDPFTKSEKPNWQMLLDTFNEYTNTHFSNSSGINRIRADISEMCAKGGLKKPGIYQLTVPTGGGKTMSSLRYSLVHALRYQKDRIFYVIPFNTILDQNAMDIREALGDYEGILEHHADVVHDTIEEQDEWSRLTERWDSTIILTSLVQFLNSLYSGKNSDVRRMKQLANSVIIFDEIQALPKRCKVLFEKAIQFLVNYCHCTILLCTATQPKLNLEVQPQEIVTNVHLLFDQLKRVKYVPQIAPVRSYDEAADQIVDFLQGGQSVLAIVNTKAASWSIFQKTCQILNKRGIMLTDGECVTNAYEKELSKNKLLCVHLNTLMCPAHRKQLLSVLKRWQKDGGKALCISTALIEAGINISFPIVIRSLASLPSIIQAAGRCNRNKQLDTGTVYIWRLYEEKLDRLPQIIWGQNVSDVILRNNTQTPDTISLPDVMNTYFKKEEELIKSEISNLQEYPCITYDREWDTTIVRLLDQNKACVKHAQELEKDVSREVAFPQSFRSAGKMFHVIDQNTKAILIPYGEGKKLINILNEYKQTDDIILTLKKAQSFSVNVFDHMFRRLLDEGAIIANDKFGVYILREEFYDNTGGVQTTPAEMAEAIY